MLNFPSEEDLANRKSKDGCGHFVPMESDHDHTYWRRTIPVMPMDLQFLITQMISIPLPEKMILLQFQD
ncbi:MULTISPECIES: hypothetical protein [unclassified Akkermansia]|jgi:hypothetical protein|uniref:hypothetical protein n=1 Tax=unclassified Akkermansia TaxID=2608915 RepID=UPI00122F39C3|nr:MULTISPECIES: hypothetical protein [unclassified Akkermansia]KAA3173190.1 hypothetical protein F2A07_05275 [Akkermansia sp. BIOML-A61]KAA3176936.1 hypothetical protein F1989_09390 [Akkermansia sp. BIOML-A53]KAA3225868.1 hypothetical protein F1959_11205 [Akkermansia sp. BIOML-A36]KAA3247569.1 hypothetical protein F1976_03235 [Akkermansia sp. BIOML-A29]KAA3252083.1 hypothetical protein F1952_11030 [Akkermansia sp. BIOML-A28]KAA3290543.1 hypothetical protein F1944_06095 [Akkermansia sp. BIOML